MFIFRKSKWGLWIIVLLLMGLFFFSILRPEPVRAPWYKGIFLTVVNPVNSSATWFSNGIRGIWDHYFALVNAAKENEILKEEVAKKDTELIRLPELAQENKRLRELLSMDIGKDVRLVGAKVTASDPRAEFKTVTVNKGYGDGVRKGMTVVGPSGLVGRIGEVGGSWSRVLLITDPNSAVDSIIERSRQRAILVGTMRSVHLRPGYFLAKLEYLHRTSDVKEGDIVITSGMDQIFPKGIPIGSVTGIDKDESGLFVDALIVPFEDMEALEEVGIIFEGGG